MGEESSNAQSALEERIRAKAYMIWEKEGRPDGRALAHWIMASEIVDSEDRMTSDNRVGKANAPARK